MWKKYISFMQEFENIVLGVKATKHTDVKTRKSSVKRRFLLSSNHLHLLAPRF